MVGAAHVDVVVLVDARECIDARRAMHDRLATGDRGDDGVQRGDVAFSLFDTDAREIGIRFAHERRDIVSGIDEPSRERAAEKSGGAGQHYAHRSISGSRTPFTPRSGVPM